MKILEMAHGIIWGPWTVGIFLIVGLVLSVRCHFFQILGFKYWWKATWGSLWEHGWGHDEKAAENAGHHGITQFQSVCTALAATVGTGTIAGVAAAIVSGSKYITLAKALTIASAILSVGSNVLGNTVRVTVNYTYGYTNDGVLGWTPGYFEYEIL